MLPSLPAQSDRFIPASSNHPIAHGRHLPRIGSIMQSSASIRRIIQCTMACIMPYISPPDFGRTRRRLSILSLTKVSSNHTFGDLATFTKPTQGADPGVGRGYACFGQICIALQAAFHSGITMFRDRIVSAWHFPTVSIPPDSSIGN
jgi:hypothetical protein